jgi:hypothetical protein
MVAPAYETSPHCLPEGTLALTFDDVPLYDAAATKKVMGGTVSLSLTVGSVAVPAGTIIEGAAVYDSQRGVYSIVAAKLDAARDQTLQFLLEESRWTTQAQDLSLTNRVRGWYFETQKSPATQTVRAVVHGGILELTAAPTSLGATVSGHLTSGVCVEWTEEECGPGTHACE